MVIVEIKRWMRHILLSRRRARLIFPEKLLKEIEEATRG